MALQKPNSNNFLKIFIVQRITFPVHSIYIIFTYLLSTDESDTDDNFLPMKNTDGGIYDSSLSSSMESSINSSFVTSATETSYRQKKRGMYFFIVINDNNVLLFKCQIWN